MTYGQIKALTQVLLSGDMSYPSDEVESAMILKYALEEVALTADTAVLSFPLEELGMYPERSIIRVTEQDRVVFRAKLPVDDESKIEMDNGLMFAVARFMASFVSVENKQYHFNVAHKIVTRYNQNNAYINGVIL